MDRKEIKRLEAIYNKLGEVRGMKPVYFGVGRNKPTLSFLTLCLKYAAEEVIALYRLKKE